MLPIPINLSIYDPNRVPAEKPSAYPKIKTGSSISLITLETTIIHMADSTKPINAPKKGFLLTTSPLIVVKAWSISLNKKITNAARNKFIIQK